MQINYSVEFKFYVICMYMCLCIKFGSFYKSTLPRSAQNKQYKTITNNTAKFTRIISLYSKAFGRAH